MDYNNLSEKDLALFYRLKERISRGERLGESEILFYEKSLLAANNFYDSLVIKFYNYYGQFYLDTKNGRFYSTPVDTDIYDFNIYNISDVCRITIIENNDRKRADSTRSILFRQGAFLTGMAGTLIAQCVESNLDNTTSKKHYITFFGLLIDFKDGTQKAINFISHNDPIKTRTKDYERIFKALEYVKSSLIACGACRCV